MEGKKTAGRQKIPLEKIEKEVARYASFSKRRLILYKKASELVRECDVDLGIFISSQTSKPYSFVHPTTNKARNKVIQINDRLNEFDAREEVAKKKICSMDQMNEARVRGWWEARDQFNAEDITKFKEWLNTTEGFLNVQLKQLENGALSSVQSPPEDADN
ncbi:hypothetical protein H5410_014034 [Solanum commersonii]|uniref:MADS-box domain-containing protein n=1 Tax=Solanum commersonii TaxID=4109 RepID=A0A9J5ZQ67_SOLCO|nr:hypothetical protein H5410_014034 [Solanum commersonii]